MPTGISGNFTSPLESEVCLYAVGSVQPSSLKSANTAPFTPASCSSVFLKPKDEGISSYQLANSTVTSALLSALSVTCTEGLSTVSLLTAYSVPFTFTVRV